MSIANFDKINVAAFHTEANNVMRELAAKYGMKFVPGNASYDHSMFKFKCEFKTSAAPSADDESSKELDNHIAFYYGKENIEAVKKLKISGTFELVGFRRRASKKPYVAINSKDGRKYIFGVEEVETQIRMAGFKSIFEKQEPIVKYFGAK